MTAAASEWPRVAVGEREFVGREMTIEPVRALRAFVVDKHGRLRSPSYNTDFIFRPGENVAACSRTSCRRNGGDGFSSCLHGFYVWHRPDRAADYANSSNLQGFHPLIGVVAAVEVYGKVDVGRDGARAEKLRIVAVECPKPSSLVKRIWARVPIAWALWGVVALCLAASIWSGIALGASDDESTGWLIALLVSILVGVAALALQAIAHVNELYTRRLYRRRPDPRAGLIAKLRRNYPDVDLVRSRKSLIRRYPVVGPYGAGDRTPDTDPTFWERV